MVLCTRESCLCGKAREEAPPAGEAGGAVAERANGFGI